MQPPFIRALVLSRSRLASAASSWYVLFGVSKNHRRKRFGGLWLKSKVAQRPRFRGTGWPQIRPPRPSEAEVLPEGLDVFLGVLDGHVDGVWRAKRAAGGASERSELTAGGLAVAAEGSGLRVYYAGFFFFHSTFTFLSTLIFHNFFSELKLIFFFIQF